MRRAMAWGALAGLAVIMGPRAAAEPSGACGGAPAAVSTNSAAVCLTTGPLKGSVKVQYLGGTNGYVVADGDSSNQSLPSNCLDGYIGVQSQGGGHSGPVASSNGDYAYPGSQPPPPGGGPLCT